ncbi:MAG: aldolase/citrate lyase family protein [Alsobacter sp.]
MTPDAPAAVNQAPRTPLAAWLAMPEPLVVEMAARAGFDWIGLDLQHGAWDLGTAFRAIQLCDALGKPVVVRLPDEQLPLIPRVLDHGSSGIVLAMASDPAVVAAAVERARYQPEGLRSYGGQRYGLRPEPRDLREVRPAIFPMIETRRGFEALDEIASIEGIGGLHIGPVDLGLGLRLGRDTTSAAFREAVARIVETGHRRRLPVTMHAVGAGEAAAWVGMGIDELVLTADVELLRTAFSRVLEGARQALGAGGQPAFPAAGGGYGTSS